MKGIARRRVIVILLTLWVQTHEASMDIGFFFQGRTHLLHNLLPEVKQSMDEYSYGRNVAYWFVPWNEWNYLRSWQTTT